MNKSIFKYTVSTNIVTIGAVEATKTQALYAAAMMMNDENVTEVTIKKELA